MSASIDMTSAQVRRRVQKLVRAFLTHRDPDQEDVVQTVMVELFTSRARYRGDCSLQSWIHAVARRTVCKYIRRRALERRVFRALDDTGQLDFHDTSDTERTVTARSALRQAAGLVGAIEPEKARALILHSGGYDLVEIAHLLGVSIAAAQTRVSRARRELRKRVVDDLERAPC
jgi:RNA polymerase sigma-70 factor (ECF subfamily)